MAIQWFYQTSEGQQSGPVDSRELRRLAETGIVRPDTLVRQGDSGRWARAEKVRCLFQPSTPAPSPSQTAAKPTQDRSRHTTTFPSQEVASEKIGWLSLRPKTKGQAKYMMNRAAYGLWGIAAFQFLAAAFVTLASGPNDFAPLGVSRSAVVLTLLATAAFKSLCAYFLWASQNRIAAGLLVIYGVLGFLGACAISGTGHAGISMGIAWICISGAVGAFRYHTLPTSAADARQGDP